MQRQEILLNIGRGITLEREIHKHKHIQRIAP